MRIRTVMMTAAAALAAAAAMAAPAMAQDRWVQPFDDHYRPVYMPAPAPIPAPIYDRGPVYDHGYGQFSRDAFGDVQGRLDRLTDFARHGAEEGWLNGWEARHAFGSLASIRRQVDIFRYRNGGGLREDQRFALNQRLDRVADYLRGQHDEARGF